MADDHEELRRSLVGLAAGARQLIGSLEQVLADDEAFDRLVRRSNAAWTASAAMAPLALATVQRFVADVLDDDPSATDGGHETP